MLDFDVKRCTRKCATSGRDLNPGETIYSTLVADGGEVKRLDYAAEEWQGPSEGVISWWQFTIPDNQGAKVQWAPSDVIRKYFKALAERDDNHDKRYILALLMVRRRMMRLEESEKDEQGAERLVLYCPKDEQEYFAPIVEPTAERARVIQDELAELLFSGGGAIVDSLAGQEAEQEEVTQRDDADQEDGEAESEQEEVIAKLAADCDANQPDEGQEDEGQGHGAEGRA